MIEAISVPEATVLAFLPLWELFELPGLLLVLGAISFLRLSKSATTAQYYAFKNYLDWGGQSRGFLRSARSGTPGALEIETETCV